MKITKFGHACLLIEVDGLRILLDPGSYSSKQNAVQNIDVVLVTHEHMDHVDLDSLNAVLKNNPKAKIITHAGVGKLLEEANIAFTLINDGQSLVEKGVAIESFGSVHAPLHSSIKPIQNTGYLIANRLFYPGDALTVPPKKVEILALPVGGPWLKLPEAIDFALEIKPKICFPVHDGILKTPGSMHKIPQGVLESNGIRFVVLDIDKEYEF